jgi:hypothetical protein
MTESVVPLLAAGLAPAHCVYTIYHPQYRRRDGKPGYKSSQLLERELLSVMQLVEGVLVGQEKRLRFEELKEKCL